MCPKNSYDDLEFNKIIDPITSHKDYQEMRKCIHHGMNRYDHMVRVAYYSYKVTKFCHLNYQETARGAVLHDFFLNDEDKDYKRLFVHPDKACDNAKKHFELSRLEEDIIKTHMFPIGKNVPKYLESWIVDIVDDVASIYEKTYVVKTNMSLNFSMLFLMFITLIRK